MEVTVHGMVTNGRRCSVFVRLPDTDSRGGLPPSSRGRATDHPWRTPNQQTQQLNLTSLRKILRRTVSHSACPSASVSPEIRVFDRHQNLCVCFPMHGRGSVRPPLAAFRYVMYFRFYG